MKARPVRGQKRSLWVCTLDADFLSQFERLRDSGVIFDAHFLQLLALDIIMRVTDALCNNGTINERSGETSKTTSTQIWSPGSCQNITLSREHKL